MQPLRHHDFAIGMPEQWTDVTSVIVMGPAQDNYSPSITITRDYLNSPTSAEAYGKQQAETLAKELEQQLYELVDEGPIELGETEAYRREHRFLVPEAGNARVQQAQVYIVDGTKAVVITATDLASRFEQTRPTLMQAIGQFHFVEPGE